MRVRDEGVEYLDMLEGFSEMIWTTDRVKHWLIDTQKGVVYEFDKSEEDGTKEWIDKGKTVIEVDDKPFLLPGDFN